MAQNQYRQRWQQEAPARQNYYGAEDGQRDYRSGAQDVPQYNQDQRLQQGWQNGTAGHDHYAAPQAYEQEGQWEDPYYQEQYQANPPGSRHPQQNPAHVSGRSYNYDDRFQREGHPRPRGAHGSQDEYAHRSQEKRRPPPMNMERRQKPRERILEHRMSPKEIAWDSPFPTFNTKKKDHKKNHSSLDKDMRGLDLHTSRSADQRPNTSQSHRKRDESRPHTSHGQNTPNAQPFESSRVPQHPSMSPLRKDPPSDREFERPDQRYIAPMQTPGRPGPNSLHNQSSAGPPQSFQNDTNSQQPYPSRSNTMPENGAGGHFQRAVTGPSNPLAISTGPVDPYRYEEEPLVPYGTPQLAQHSDYPPVQKSRSHGPPMTNTAAYGGPYAGNEYDADPALQRHQDGYLYSEGSAAHPEIPNFDAISPNTHEKEEVHFDSNPYAANGQPAYQKRPYQAPAPFKPQLDTQRTRVSEPSSNLQSPSAGFAFDIPANRPRSPATAAPSARTAYLDYSEQWGNEEFPVQPTQHQRPEQPQQVANETARFPPRTASRSDQQPRSTSDARQHPLPSSRGYQQQSPDYTQSARPNTSHGSSNRNQPYDYQQRPNPFAQNDNAQSDHQLSMENPSLIGSSGPRLQALPQNFSHLPQKPYAAGLDQRPKTSSSAHPPPVRHYGAPTSLDNQGAYNRQNSFGSQTSPDGLPAHPVPVRPGLASGPDAPQSQPRSNGMVQPQMVTSQRRDFSGQEAIPKQSIEATRTAPIVTVSELNTLQQAVKNNPSDYQLALKFAKKLVEAASVLSNDGGKADAKTIAKNRERYILDAHKIVKKLVNAGYPDAMFYLADCHGQGLLGFAPDPKEAFSLYQSAAKLNHAPSAYRVAVCCEMGQEDGGGTRRDPLKAIQWYKRAATLGDTPAMYKMGMILLKGLLGQQRNPREALSWLKRAAERADRDNPHALHELGLLYESATPNDYIVRDEKYALQLFKQAAELGYKYSQFRLGSASEYGLLGCPVDARQSIAWYTRAATQSEHQSELALSGWYLTGSEGILQQSDTEAYLWARKAASSGLAKAEYAMGYFTEVGIGVPANLEEAKKWYYRAASQGFPKARERIEDLKRGGQKMQKTRVSRSAVSKQNEGECVVM